MGSGAPRILEFTATSNTVVVTHVSIAPILLVHPLLLSHLLSPKNACIVLETWVRTLGLIQKVSSFLDWLMLHTNTTNDNIDALTITVLEDLTMYTHQYLMKIMVPPPLYKSFPPNHPPTHLVSAKSFSTFFCSCQQQKPAMCKDDRWVDYLWSLMGPCNINAVNNLSHILWTVILLSRYPSIVST